MATKEERYDPAINYNSDQELEQNNLKDKHSPQATGRDPLWGDLIFNDTRSGGPLEDKDKKEKTEKKQKLGICISCGADHVPLFQGNRYRCHKSEKAQREHNSFCLSCAMGVDEDGDIMQCPKHLLTAWPETERIEPLPVYEE